MRCSAAVWVQSRGLLGSRREGQGRVLHPQASTVRRRPRISTNLAAHEMQQSSPRTPPSRVRFRRACSGPRSLRLYLMTSSSNITKSTLISGLKARRYPDRPHITGSHCLKISLRNHAALHQPRYIIRTEAVWMLISCLSSDPQTPLLPLDRRSHLDLRRLHSTHDQPMAFRLPVPLTVCSSTLS